MPQEPAKSLGRVLFRRKGVSARIAWYPPGMRLDDHAHDVHQVSILLSGTLGECVRGSDERLTAPAVGVKPAGAVHANDYGPMGALLLGFEFEPGTDLQRDLGLAEAWAWRGLPAPALAHGRQLLAGLHAGAGSDDAETNVWDFVAALATPATRASPGHGGPAPRWIARVEQRLHEDCATLAEIAREEGLHPASLSRSFARWKGCRPSVLRRRARMHRALVALSRGEPPAVAAQQAGFADQAHLCRAARECSGLSPRQLGALLR